MKSFNVKWDVTEIVNGPGRHDNGVRDGDRTIVASGEVTVPAPEGSAENLRTSLTADLEDVFPRHAVGPTYDLDRIYNIEVTEV